MVAVTTAATLPSEHENCGPASLLLSGSTDSSPEVCLPLFLTSVELGVAFPFFDFGQGAHADTLLW